MQNYIIRRLIYAVITFFGITVLVFTMANLAPGSPLDGLMADPGMTEAELERRAAQLGLDKPVIVQYFSWCKELCKGNMGYSYTKFRPVKDMIFERLGPTLMLTCSAILASYVFGVPLGVVCSVKHYSFSDYIVSTLAFIATGLPGFFLGMLLIYWFSIKLGWLPMNGMFGADGSRSVFTVIQHLVLPSMAIALPEIGKVMRHVRSNLLETMQNDYIRTERAKGLREWKVIMAHGFRNTLIPIVTIFSGSIPFLFGGSVVVESVFSWPGLGTLMVTAINNRDYPVIMGASVVTAVVVLVAYLLVDLLYGLIDPRIVYD